MMSERKTKSESGKANEVMTRKTRKVAAMKIADVEDVSPADVGEINDFPLLKQKRAYKPRIKRVPGRKKTDKYDGLYEAGIRYENVLKSVFAELNTDRTFDGFAVSCNVGMPYEGHIGAVFCTAKLTKNGYPIHMIEAYVLRYPSDVEDLATALYVEMNYRGLDVAEALGV